ncbi:hypothetical protein EXIGLDRAFT_833733 [Exidia glandulosa HHB12029]|uniref:Uncharacterized protein n=1 Tax=Exidia glandulosa HHB12029 TaxID=1314781 RepID=A0A165KF22_EXIGL|nr:hypothetical protein EXIGLDRAFT_833733 [Exidia glandulosa HHB12029]
MVGRWRLLCPTFVLYFFALFTTRTHAQAAELVNGQQFTRGLAVIDAPAPNSQHNAPGNMPIAIDVSGNGKLQSLGDNSRFESLDLFLVSDQVGANGVNITVSSGPTLLEGEPGSTVKHLDFAIPACLPAGNYNLTFYEASMFQGQAVYAITTVSIKLASKAASGGDANFSCISPPPTVPEAQPQAQSPLTFAPFAPDAPPLSTATSSAPSESTPPAVPPTSSSVSADEPDPPPDDPSSGRVQQDPTMMQASPSTSATPGGFFVPVAANSFRLVLLPPWTVSAAAFVCSFVYLL